MRRYASAFGVVVGVGMLGLWGALLIAGEVPEVETEPVRLGFHLAAEAITAVTLLVAGVAMGRGKGWARDMYLVGLGLLAYTVTVSPGYYAQQGDWPMVGMFAGIALGSAVAFLGVRGARV